MLDHDTSLINCRRMPSRRAKPCSAAATRTAMSTRGMNPTRTRRSGTGRPLVFEGVSSTDPAWCMGLLPASSKSHTRLFLQKGSCRHYTLGDVDELPFLVHGGLAKKGISLPLRELPGFHENALGPLDHLAGRQFAASLQKLALQTIEGIEAAHRHVHDGLHPLLAQSIDHIG